MHTIGSTVVGQLADSRAFISPAFYGTVPLDALAKMAGMTLCFRISEGNSESSSPELRGLLYFYKLLFRTNFFEKSLTH
jgi:hypothetical protein